MDWAREGGRVFHDVVRWEPWHRHRFETGPWSIPPGSRPGMACRPLSCPDLRRQATLKPSAVQASVTHLAPESTCFCLAGRLTGFYGRLAAPT